MIINNINIHDWKIRRLWRFAADLWMYYTVYQNSAKYGKIIIAETLCMYISLKIWHLLLVCIEINAPQCWPKQGKPFKCVLQSLAERYSLSSPCAFFLLAVRNVHYRGCFKLLKSIIGTFPVYSFQPNLTTQSCIETCTDKVWISPLQITAMMINLLHTLLVVLHSGSCLLSLENTCRSTELSGFLLNILGLMCL